MKNKDKLRQHEEANRQQKHGFVKQESGKNQPSSIERDSEKMKDRELEPESMGRF